jgi:lipopolysaccharide transport system permease protein
VSTSTTTLTPPAELPIVEIAPARGWVPVRLRDIWEYRELLYFFIWRDVKVRYKQTALGVAWAVLQPLLTMAVFTIFFGRLAKIDTGGVPYPVFAYVALLPWQLFAFALTDGSQSVVTHQRLLTKVYFPRLILPLASIAVGLVDFALSFAVLLGLMTYYGVAPGPAVLTVPFWTLAAVVTAVAVALWLSALNVRYRDVRYTLPFLTQLWLLSTPVAYPSSIVPDAWRAWYALNPMAGVVEGFRWALLGGEAPGLVSGISLAVVLATLVTGLFYFRRTERTFADIV